MASPAPNASGDLGGGLVVDAGGATSVTIRSSTLLKLVLGVPPGTGSDGIVRADATSNGVAGGIDVDAIADAVASSRTTATGIGLGGGSGNSVANAGTVQVIGQGVVDARALANGNAGVSGDATATASGNLADSVGRALASGARLTLDNSKIISVEMRPVAGAIANAGANGLGITDPDARATAVANASNTVAMAIDTAGGTLINSGDIRALSAPRAEAVAGARPSGTFNTSIDAFASASAVVTGTQAYGIRSINNALILDNSGTISARALPTAIARAGAFGNGADGDASASAFASTLNALAVGIDMLAAGSSITNTGSIIAEAVADTQALPQAVKTGSGSQLATPLSLAGSNSYGIRAGGGTNTIVNRGVISGAVAIQTGSGVDTVSLLGGSTSGTIDLGGGDDSLTIRNTPVVGGQLIGGSGVDSIFIDGGRYPQRRHQRLRTPRQDRRRPGQFRLHPLESDGFDPHRSRARLHPDRPATDRPYADDADLCGRQPGGAGHWQHRDLHPARRAQRGARRPRRLCQRHQLGRHPVGGARSTPAPSA